MVTQLFYPAGLTATEKANIGSGGRELLTADRTYYVDPAGNDSNDGLTIGTPFLTIQKAIDTTIALDFSIYNVFIQLANGTYNVISSNDTKNYVGSGDITIQGDIVTPSNVIITTSDGNSGTTFSGEHQTGTYRIKGIRFQTTRTSGFTVLTLQSASGIMIVSDCEVADHTGPGTAQLFRAQSSGNLTLGDNITVEGGAQVCMAAVSLGKLRTTGGTTFTLSSTPNFTFAFAVTDSLATIDSAGVTFSGSATGTRYDVTSNSVINTQGSGPNYFPGNAPGNVTSGGIYI